MLCVQGKAHFVVWRFLRIGRRGIACHSLPHHLRATQRLSAPVPVSRARGIACSCVTAIVVPATGSLRVTSPFSRAPSLPSRPSTPSRCSAPSAYEDGSCPSGGGAAAQRRGGCNRRRHHRAAGGATTFATAAPRVVVHGHGHDMASKHHHGAWVCSWRVAFPCLPCIHLSCTIVTASLQWPYSLYTFSTAIE
jgi:hypothetical protein